MSYRLGLDFGLVRRYKMITMVMPLGLVTLRTKNSVLISLSLNGCVSDISTDTLVRVTRRQKDGVGLETDNPTSRAITQKFGKTLGHPLGAIPDVADKQLLHV
ncbi:hypothetical protein TNIN_475161 [Trichonephila inaurata madagascariensis]|uniref:Uncharacterized protein n=1 Tax=Trichonephila inaurata madagascariensis TaxID=2747483 RepID=A0A8X7BU30_9ARAC|nr:hypothetical protein TNIN_475161 [Trichonephila inaurata madagascariensis]